MNGNAKEIPLWRAMPEQIEAHIAKLEQEKHELLKQRADMLADLKSIHDAYKKGLYIQSGEISIMAYEKHSK